LPNYMEKEKWGDSLKYPEIYHKLETFAPKAILNEQLVEAIVAFKEREHGDEEIEVAELGAGPAPISEILTTLDPEGYKCKAFDINPNMKNEREYPFDYDFNFDLTDPYLNPAEIGRYDVVVLENVLYTTSMSSDNTSKYSAQEANLMKLAALKKAAGMLKPYGILLLTDPLNKTEDFGVSRIVEFLQIERDAIQELTGKDRSFLGVFLKDLADKDMRRMLSINKKIMSKAVLNSEESMKSMIQYTDLFYPPMYWNPDTYLGSNLTAILRRNEEEVYLENAEYTSLNRPIIFEGKIHPNILHWIGEFRKRVYAETNATNNLPEVDIYDRKEEGVVAVYPSKNKLGIGATATLQQRGAIGLDIEHLMQGERGDFYKDLLSEIRLKSKKIDEKMSLAGDINFAEIRRLAADNLGISEFAKFFQSLCDTFFNCSKRNDIDVVLFVSDDKRAKAFNLVNKKAEFKKLDGFKLNRESTDFQTMMICAANYFFKDWESVLSPEEANYVKNLSMLVSNGYTWTEVIEGREDEAEYKAAVKKLLDEAEDNVSIYFTDYPMNH